MLAPTNAHGVASLQLTPIGMLTQQLVNHWAHQSNSYRKDRYAKKETNKEKANRIFSRLFLWGKGSGLFAWRKRLYVPLPGLRDDDILP